MELEQRIKHLEWGVMILAVIISGAIIYIALSGKSADTYDDSKLRQSIANMQEGDRIRDSISTRNSIKRTQDSIRYTAISNRVDNIPIMINTINKRYDDKRNHIITLSADQQLELFAIWLSTADSL